MTEPSSTGPTTGPLTAPPTSITTPATTPPTPTTSTPSTTPAPNTPLAARSTGGPTGSRAELAEKIRATALAVPGVADLHTGTFGEVATYLPGGKVDGIRLRDDSVEVHLVVGWDVPVLPVADAVRAAVRALDGMADRPVQVVVQDLAAPPGVAGSDVAADSAPAKQ